MAEAQTEIAAADLAGFIGTQEWHRASLGLLFTDGIKFLADSCGAHWLIDLVASYQPRLRRDEGLREFQLWRLELNERSAVTRRGVMCSVIATCRRDTGLVPVVKQRIPLSDFPRSLLPFKWYVEGDVMLLPSEH